MTESEIEQWTSAAQTMSEFIETPEELIAEIENGQATDCGG